MSGTKRRITGVVAVCTLAMTAAACSGGGGGGGTNPGGNSTQSTGQPVRGGTLNMLGAGDVDFMDPNISYYSIGYLGLREWSRQLFTYPADPNRVTTAVPDIATEIPTVANGGVSKDGKTYTIHIRDGVKWNTSPARPVTAQDEVRGVMRTCNPIKPFGGIPDFATLIQGYQKFCDGFAKAGKTASALAKYMDSNSISGVQAKDDKTVVFKLTQPATYFVDMLTMPAFSPAPEDRARRPSGRPCARRPKGGCRRSSRGGGICRDRRRSPGSRRSAAARWSTFPWGRSPPPRDS